MSAGRPVRRRPSSSLTALYGWLASHAAKRWVSLILIACILPVDLALPWQGWSFTVRALLDEPCHQATGLICLGAITRFRGRPPDPRFGWAMLICSNAIDLDHLPLEFGSSVLTAGTPRPYSHALWVVVVLGLAALAARAWSQRAGTRASATTVLVLFGAACGVSDHFLHDIATAQMSLWWPITDAPVQVPYWWYVAAIVVIALIPVTRQRGNDNRGKAAVIPGGLRNSTAAKLIRLRASEHDPRPQCQRLRRRPPKTCRTLYERHGHLHPRLTARVTLEPQCCLRPP